MSELSRLIYVDDSGSERFGYIVFGWVECSPAHWSAALATWLAFRRDLWLQYGIPTRQELHATDYVNGRGAAALAAGRGAAKAFGEDLAQACLDSIGRNCHLRVGAVFRQTEAKGRAYHRERSEVYLELITQWNHDAIQNEDYIAVNMDGDGTDSIYAAAHRSLDLETRRIIDDPAFRDSRQSQWTQMADLVAYIAYCYVDRHDRNRFAWDLYSTHLSQADPESTPKRM